MNTADYILLGLTLFSVGVVVATIRTEIKDIRDHRRFMASLRRRRVIEQRFNPEGV